MVQGDIGNLEVGLAISGSLDFSSADPRLALGVAGTRMSVAALKKLWPFCVTPKVREWAEDHLVSGMVERMAIATNAPLSTLKTSGPPVPDDGLSIDIVGSGAEIRPVLGLPPIRDAKWDTIATSRRFGSSHQVGCNAVFGDGSVHTIHYSVSPEVFRRACVRDDGLPFSHEDL